MNKHLATYQNKLNEIAARADALLRGAERPSSMALGKIRWGLARALNEYQVFKHSRVFDPILIGPAGPRADLAAEMREACMKLGAEYRQYVAQWHAADILDHWAEYQPAALAMIARIRAHIEIERVNLARLDAMTEDRRAA